MPKVGYNNAHLKSIRDRDTYLGTALKNVSDTYDQLLADLDNGQQKGDVSEATKDINHMILRLQAIWAAIAPAEALASHGPFLCQGCGREEGVCSADPCPAVIADREAL